MAVATWAIRRWKQGSYEQLDDEVVEEVPLTLYVNEREVVTLLTLGEHPDELAMGFLYAEGFIGRLEDVLSLEQGQGEVWVKTVTDPELIARLMDKRTVTTGCGKGTTFYQTLDALRLEPVKADVLFPPEQILGRMGELQSRSGLYRRTGGTHNASLAEPDSTLLFRSDIGRHNAVDMLGGRALLDGLEVGRLALFTTGRVSSEILLKTAKMGVGVLVSRSAPTALALRMAEKLDVTVVGYVRGERMNVYTRPERISGT